MEEFAEENPEATIKEYIYYKKYIAKNAEQVYEDWKKSIAGKIYFVKDSDNEFHIFRCPKPGEYTEDLTIEEYINNNVKEFSVDLCEDEKEVPLEYVKGNPRFTLNNIKSHELTEEQYNEIMSKVRTFRNSMKKLLSVDFLGFDI